MVNSDGILLNFGERYIMNNDESEKIIKARLSDNIDFMSDNIDEIPDANAILYGDPSETPKTKNKYEELFPEDIIHADFITDTVFVPESPGSDIPLLERRKDIYVLHRRGYSYIQIWDELNRKWPDIYRDKISDNQKKLIITNELRALEKLNEDLLTHTKFKLTTAELSELLVRLDQLDVESTEMMQSINLDDAGRISATKIQLMKFQRQLALDRIKIFEDFGKTRKYDQDDEREDVEAAKNMADEFLDSELPEHELIERLSFAQALTRSSQKVKK